MLAIQSNEDYFFIMDDSKLIYNKERQGDFQLISKACDDNNPKRSEAKSKLLEHLYRNYLGILIWKAAEFENNLHGIKLPDSYDEICKDFIIEVLEKDKLCKWGRTALAKSLMKMLNNYLTDIMRDYCGIECEKDIDGKKIKDEKGKYNILSVETKRPNLTMGEKLFMSKDDNAEEVIEHRDLYKKIKHDLQEDEYLTSIMLKELEKLGKEALRRLQKSYPRDADIIYMEMKGFSRKEMASKLKIEPSGINTTFKRALERYAIIFKSLLKEKGITTDVPIKELSKYLHNVILD